jgi:hypothetical protein
VDTVISRPVVVAKRKKSVMELAREKLTTSRFRWDN